ncbi:hypothetical protein [Nocardiopsis synnemataformans]|uniref:hypothetical protein n=1 Tax=Nocardiopsis synnemataformans TaxID=61305 RepID=UPI003EBCC088
MRAWMKIATVLGCCVLVALVFVPPYGQTSGRGETVCAPVIGQAPAREYIDFADSNPDYLDLHDDQTGDTYDLTQSAIVCEHRRSARLAWAVLVAVPTSAILGAWVHTVVTRARDD